jgi:hypothetical protein
MWEDNINRHNVKFEELFSVLANLTEETIKEINYFITIRKLSNRWPYDSIKDKVDTETKFKKYFKNNIASFDRIYAEWKDYAKRNRSDKTTISERVT